MDMDVNKKILTITLLACALIGCTSLTFRGMYNLYQLDPFTTDPHQIHVAVVTVDAVVIKQGNVVLNIAYQANDDSVKINEAFNLIVSEQQLTSNTLPNSIGQNNQATFFTLSDANRKTFQNIQHTLYDLKQQGTKGVGSFGINVNDICISKSIASDATLDIYVQTLDTDGFFLLLEDLQVKELALDKNNKIATCELA